MDVTFASFLPLIGGYLYVVGFTALKYKVAREDGWRLYFRVAYHGVWFFVLSLVILSLVYLSCDGTEWFAWLERHLVDLGQPLLKNPERPLPQIGFVLLCILSVALGRISSPIMNFTFRKSVQNAIWKAAEESELEEFLLEAMLLLRLISITLSSNKVYVGQLIKNVEPQKERRVIAILPTMSGYRDEKTGKVTFTTYYDQFYRDSEEDVEKFKMILPVDKMNSLSFFDPDIYEKFNATPPPADPQMPPAIPLAPADSAPVGPA